MSRWHYEMSDEDRVRFAARLKAFRKKWGLSQKDLARALGINHATVNTIELCRNAPFPGTILKVAELERRYERAKDAELEGLDGLS